MATLASVIQIGTRGAQPAATAVSIGTLYSVTDEGNKVERSDGATWTQYAPTAGGTVTTTGSPANGDIAKFSSATAITNAAVTGSGSVVLATSPTLVTPALGTPSSGTLSGCSGLPAATGLTGVVPGTQGGGLVLLEQHSASVSATLDFTTFISSTYDEYLFELVNVIPATDGALLWMRMGTGAGPSFDTGANYSYRYLRIASATAIVTAAGGTKIIVSDAIDDDSKWGIVGSIRLFSPQSSALRKMIVGHLFFEQTAAGSLEQSLCSGIYDSLTVLTGIQFLASTGNLTSGTIRVYGVAK